MFRASTIIRNAREDKGLSIEEISKKLKINSKYLSSIEDERAADFPDEPYCSLIIKDYSNFLGLNSEDVLSLFRRDFATSCKVKPVTHSKISLTPHHTFRVLTIASIFLFIAYLSFEYVKFNRAPSLKVNWPDLNGAQLEISGITDPESTVRVNNDLILVDPSGSFKKTINVATESTVIVESKSQSGKTTVVEKTYK